MYAKCIFGCYTYINSCRIAFLSCFTMSRNETSLKSITHAFYDNFYKLYFLKVKGKLDPIIMTAKKTQNKRVFLSTNL